MQSPLPLAKHLKVELCKTLTYHPFVHHVGRSTKSCIAVITVEWPVTNTAFSTGMKFASSIISTFPTTTVVPEKNPTRVTQAGWMGIALEFWEFLPELKSLCVLFDKDATHCPILLQQYTAHEYTELIKVSYGTVLQKTRSSTLNIKAVAHFLTRPQKDCNTQKCCTGTFTKWLPCFISQIELMFHPVLIVPNLGF